MLKIVKPTKKDREKIEHAINLFYQENNNYDTLHGASFFGGIFNFDEWLNSVYNYENSINLPDDHVGASQFLIMHDNEIIGFINIRHNLNKYLRELGGHIGYSILPDKRKKGYATIALKLALKECTKLNIKDVLITCDDNNIASYKTIEKCGGSLENIVKGNDGERDTRRYFIKL